VRADQKRAGLLYAGTEFGMYISYDDGTNWKPFQLNLPLVSITDLTIKENDLIVATQGRAFWVLDDLSMVQQLNNNLSSKNLHVFTPAETFRKAGSVNKNVKNAGMNPANGVVINYFLKNVSDTAKVSVSLYDPANKLIRTYSTKDKVDEKIEAKSGMNQFVWNLNYPAVEKIDAMILWNGNVTGQKAIPGNYKAMIKSGQDSSAVNFVIKSDPNYQMSTEDFKQQFDFLTMVKDKFSETQTGIKEIRNIRAQLNSFTEKSKDLPKEIKDKATEINKKITAIEETLYQTKSKSGQDVLNFPIRLNDKLSGVFNAANSGYAAPSKQVKEVYSDLASQIDVEIAKLKTVKQTDLKEFNDLVRAKAIPVIVVN